MEMVCQTLWNRQAPILAVILDESYSNGKDTKEKIYTLNFGRTNTEEPVKPIIMMKKSHKRQKRINDFLKDFLKKRLKNWRSKPGNKPALNFKTVA
jgi:hypothetical protein